MYVVSIQWKYIPQALNQFESQSKTRSTPPGPNNPGMRGPHPGGPPGPHPGGKYH